MVVVSPRRFKRLMTSLKRSDTVKKKNFIVRSGPERVLASSRGKYLVQVLGGRQLLALRFESAAATETLLASLA